ncbi:MAG: endonuclease/exonuclease/phosphatase family protein [Myxococcales bacterium]
MNPLPDLRVASWNLKSCEFGLERIATELKALDADVVALQEVDRGTLRSGRLDQVQELASRAGFSHFHFFKAVDWNPGDYGLGLLARWPLGDTRTLPLPVPRGLEPRILASASLTLPSGLVRVHVTHLTHVFTERALRRRQVRFILDAIEADAHPHALLLGDFNDLPGSPMHQEASGALQDVFATSGEGPGGTFPFISPLVAVPRIDYAFATPALRPLRSRVKRTDASDHFILTAELQHVREDVALPARSAR